MNILTVANLSKRFAVGNTVVQALYNVSFSVETGSIVAIMGSSGSGKTTLLNILGGLETMDAGHIYFDDEKTSSTF